ncbi:MAG: CDP-alcohol phosphatidyltransferase family protein [Alphaproteobacteria bacterium]|nr:CDP-alcohol phosphatidyltransferase family protein [Alphaproteobacteria bacterium]
MDQHIYSIADPRYDLREMDSGRALNGIFAGGERTLLRAIAARTPKWVLPDHLTTLAFVGAGVCGLSLIASNCALGFLWLAVIGLALNWLGDSLDGTLARVRNIERPRYGFYVDHVSDLGSQILIVIGLGLSPFLRFDITLLALVGYLGLSVLSLVKLHVSRSFQLSYFGIGPTEIRIVIGSGIVIAASMELPKFELAFGQFHLFDFAAILLFVVACATGLFSFFQDAGKLALVDPPRHIEPGEVIMRKVGD